MKGHAVVGLFCLLAVPGIAGCAPTDIKWTEEVKLHDGSVIQLKRRTELTSSGFPVQKRGFSKYHEFCYVPMNIHWKSKPQYRPEVFDIVNGRAYAKVSLGSCASCTLHGYPETDALYFIWEDGAWKKIRYEEYPNGVLRLNLLMNPKGRDASDDVRGLVTLKDKEHRDLSVHYELRKTGKRGLNETMARRGICNKCKAIDTKTDDTADVFLPVTSKNCAP